MWKICTCLDRGVNIHGAGESSGGEDGKED